MTGIVFAIGVAAVYVIGAIPFGYIIARVRAGIDIREHGSGNIGATNVGRVLGLRFFAITFALDFLKGTLPVAGALLIESRFGEAALPSQARYLFAPLVGLAAILGHMFPVYLRFRGGKGVATSIGVVMLIAPVGCAAGLVAWAILVLTTRMISVGSIGFAIALVAGYFATVHKPMHEVNVGASIFVVAAAAMVIFRHRSNMARIAARVEPRIRMPWEKDV